jgi:hypothetical protein
MATRFDRRIPTWSTTRRAALVVLTVATSDCGTIPVPASGAQSPLPSGASCCTALERGVLAELNRARTDPQGFAADLETRLQYYRGYVYRAPGSDIGLRTVEGPDAVREAIRVLRATRPLPALRLSRGMSLAAADHVRDQGPRGGTGHTGRDGSTAAARVSRYGRWYATISESIQYGRGDAREVVEDLLIDDGVRDRGHRRNALDPNVHVAGVACGPHAVYGQMCVIEHAGDYAERSAATRSGGAGGVR